MSKRYQPVPTTRTSPQDLRDTSNQEAPAQISSLANLDDNQCETGRCLVCQRCVATSELNHHKFCGECQELDV